MCSLTSTSFTFNLERAEIPPAFCMAFSLLNSPHVGLSTLEDLLTQNAPPELRASPELNMAVWDFL